MLKQPPKKIDVMLMEGSSLGRLADDEVFPTESALERIFIERFKTTQGMALVVCSAQNIDRVKIKQRERDGALLAETHYKYLVDRAKREYRTFSFDTEQQRWCFDTNDEPHFIREYEGKATLSRLISNATPYAGDEKTQVHSILRKNKNIIDVEVAFTTLLEREGDAETEEEAEEKEEKSRVDRIDMVALEEKSGGSISIVFYEVKTFDDPRIRARGNAEVLGTLEDYRDAIKQAESHIRTAYAEVCRDLVFLQRPVGGFDTKLDPLIEMAARDDTVLSVDPNPRLVIVGYSTAQWDALNWQTQLEKLKRHFWVEGWRDGGSVGLPGQYHKHLTR